MASSSSSVHNKSYQYDVFLSFCGVDTRKTFVDHLYAALDQHGIRTFKDDERLEKGKKINDELLQSIEDSRLCIIVFSKNYASSSWCLNELLKIMECHTSNEQTAFPVFYDVDPSEVRKQTGSVGAALAIHKNEAEVGKWKQALKKAADLSGWDVRKTANGHEAKVIKLIVERLSLELRYINMDVDENLVGMEKRMQDLDSCLEISTDDHVRMIGIKGKGGAGKTTLAWAIFNKIFMNFECQSFVENVKDKAKIGLEKLQEQVLRDVLKDKNITVNGLHEGENLMKNKLRGKKVLLVLDDVDDINQLKMLAGDTTWFKPGSRIIITTRDEQVLEEHKVILIHDVNLLLEEEAIYLFSRHAFGKDIPTQEYEMLSREVVSCANGLPLTIKVLGSKLYGKDNEEWAYTLKRLKSMRSKEILAKLELSYESLEDHHKDIFLDVACFLKGWKKEDAIRNLESYGYHAKYGLRVLEQKSLIVTVKRSYDETIIDMHDHLVEMGKNIVRREHPNEPDKHSRLWIQEEIKHALAGKSGSEVVRCIDLKITPGIYVKGLANMKKLRCLIVSQGNDNFSHGGPWYFFGRSWKHEKARQCFPSSLQYLYWKAYPYWCLPKTFEANNLVTLVMSESKIKRLWEGEKVMKNLKYLDLSDSKELRSLDLGMTPNLERLSLEGCYKLVNVDVYGGCLKSLVDLNLNRCQSLKPMSFIKQFESLEVLSMFWLLLWEFPEYIVTGHSINSLQELDLSWNDNIKEIPSSIGNLHKLVSLNLSLCKGLKSLPSSIGNLHKLVSLNLYGCLDFKSLPSSIGNLHKLVSLDLSFCHELKSLPSSIGNLHKLVSLNLSWCYKLKSLPSSIGNLHNLVSLNLSDCSSLKSLPGSIWSLQHLITLNLLITGIEELPEEIGQLECLEYLHLSLTKVKHLPDSICMLKHLKTLLLESCSYLEKLPEDVGQLESLEILKLGDCSNLREIPNSICNLKCLKELNLERCNRLSKLPDEIGDLKSLEELDVRDTGITQLPQSLSLLKGLKVKERYDGEPLYVG